MPTATSTKKLDRAASIAVGRRPCSKPSGFTPLAAFVVLTTDKIEAGKSDTGGWNKKQLGILGESFRHGWKRRLVGKKVPEAIYAKFLALRGQGKQQIKRAKQMPLIRCGVAGPPSKARPRSSLPRGQMEIRFAPCAPDIPWAEQYLHPNWQRVRAWVFTRDNYTCTRCGETQKQLHVHHLKYKRGAFVWEAPLRTLITLCATCHEKTHPHSINSELERGYRVAMDRDKT